MALQVNLGTVQVVKGQTTVLHEWKLLMATTSGFSVGASVTWTGGGTGTVGAWDSVTKTLHVTRTGGLNPAAGVTISQPSPAASAVISSVAPGSPPNWNAKVTLPAVATFERHYADYQVASVDFDSFVLQTGYLGENARNSEYGLNTDFTSLGLGVVRPGDVGATAIITRSMIRINTLLQRAFATLRLSSDLALTDGMDATVSWGIEEEDDGGFISSVPTASLVVPSGIKRVLLGVNLTLTAALSTGSQAVTASLLKNATIIARHSIEQPGVALSLSRMVTVAASDVFSVKIAAVGSSLPSILASTETNFSIGVLEVT